MRIRRVTMYSGVVLMAYTLKRQQNRREDKLLLLSGGRSGWNGIRAYLVVHALKGVEFGVPSGWVEQGRHVSDRHEDAFEDDGHM